MARETVTISLPPPMRKQLERVRKAENRTSSELVREALRQYFERRYPEITPSRAELAAIRSGRVEIQEGRYVTLPQLLNELAPARRTSRAKNAREDRR